MPAFKDRRFLPYSQQQMFDLVADVASYKDFLPWCLGTRVYNRREDGFDADMIIGFKMFKEKIVSRVSLQEPNKVNVDYMDGPLKRLYNHWVFEPASEGCMVDFAVELEFKSRMLENLIGEVFTKATFRMIHAFEERAKDLYGTPK